VVTPDEIANSIITIIHAAIRGLEISFVIISLALKKHGIISYTERSLNMGIIVNIAIFINRNSPDCRSFWEISLECSSQASARISPSAIAHLEACANSEGQSTVPKIRVVRPDTKLLPAVHLRQLC
jgi:hypothetical protein